MTAASLNKVTLIGNVGADPESRRTQDGREIVHVRLATSESWKDKATGQRRERTEWHRVTVFNEGLCRVVSQYVKKGAKLYIEGQLQTSKWTDRAGVERYSTDIVLQGFASTLLILEFANNNNTSSPSLGQGAPYSDSLSESSGPLGEQSSPSSSVFDDVAPLGSFDTESRSGEDSDAMSDDDVPF